MGKRQLGRLRAIDVFSGCGGLTLGLKQANFEVVAAIENEEKAASVYELNHPTTKLYKRDIRDLSPDTLMRDLNLKPGQLDLIAGCPPCQGFSRIRRRNKKRLVVDIRNMLIDDFARFVFALMPKMVMMENVPALRDYHRFRKFLSLLRKSGYLLRFEVLDVSEYGVPQRRHRLIMVASMLRHPDLALPNPVKKTVYDAIGSIPIPGSGKDALHDLPDRRSQKVLNIIEGIRVDGGSRIDLPDNLKLLCHRKSNGFSDVYGRMAWDKPSPTITSGCNNPSKGRFIHPDQNRSVTLREAALLQGFPRDYIFDTKLGKEALALMIGNALPPPFVKAHAQAMSTAFV